MHPALSAIRQATLGTSFEGRVWLVGGAVRDELLGKPEPSDLDLVLTGSSVDLAELLHSKGISEILPVEYARFGTALLRVAGADVELVTARKESYQDSSRKPTVTAATLEDDARRRDFTVNALMRNIHSDELYDPLGVGLEDLRNKVLRTPLDPAATFYDDPLRMLRAVRFRWQLGFMPVEGLYDAVKKEAPRLQIISAERTRDEWVKMLSAGTAPEAMQDLLDLGLLHEFAPEFDAMVGVEQGSFHHLDVWDHTLKVLKNAGSGDLQLSLAALLHDIAKPITRTVDKDGRTRFFSHEVVGAQMARAMLRRLRFPIDDVEAIAKLVKNHMRLGTAASLSASAARRLVRDLDNQLEQLILLVDADANALKPGVRALDTQAIRKRIAEVTNATPRHTLESPLSGEEIMSMTGLEPGSRVGSIKQMLLEAVLDGKIKPGDKEGARRMVESFGD